MQYITFHSSYSNENLSMHVHSNKYYHLSTKDYRQDVYVV
jgi:hypothetical protein